MIALVVAGIIVASALLAVGYLLGSRDGIYGEDAAIADAFDQGYRLGEAKGYCTGYARALAAASPSVVKGAS